MADPWEHKAEPWLRAMPWIQQGCLRESRDSSHLIEATRARGESPMWKWAHEECGYLPVTPQQRENPNSHGP